MKDIGVLDGDTLEVIRRQRPERIRLSGIDCPEKGQAYGQKAKQAASELVYGKEVTLETHGLDKYGRTLADVRCPMAQTSITKWSETAGAGGTGSMRRGIRHLKS
ncbi:MAG: thermonuclease family protein [Nitrospirota bacterium]